MFPLKVTLHIEDVQAYERFNNFITGTAPAKKSAITVADASSQQAAKRLGPARTTDSATTKTTEPAAATAQSASSESSAQTVTFDELKKAFLALSTKADGRAKCQAVLGGLAKLSDAKPEQYAGILAAIEKAA